MARRLGWLVPGVTTGALVPAVAIAGWWATGTLAADPIAEALHRTGRLALVLLLACLACTPLARASGWTWPHRLRRTLGLLAFGYAAAHVLVLYVVLDQGARLGAVVADLLERRYLLFGALAFGLLVPLAATSTRRAVARLGFRWWKRLHRLVYPAAALAVLHFASSVKQDLTEPLVHAAVLGLLLLARGIDAARPRPRREAPVPRPDP